VDPQLTGHVRTARRVGLTREEIIEVFVHLAPYVGAPKALAGRISGARQPFAPHAHSPSSGARPRPAADRVRRRRALGRRAHVYPAQPAPSYPLQAVDQFAPTEVGDVRPITRYVALRDGNKGMMVETWVNRSVRPADFGLQDRRELGLLVEWDFSAPQ